MIDIYHQLGFRFQWNLTSLTEDNAGDGVIIGPRYMPRDKAISLPVHIRRCSFFDPQFFLPHSPRGALATYEFFPEVIAEGFATSEYEGAVAAKCAELCIRFQIENSFRYCVIPTRCQEGLPRNFIEAQAGLFVEPFLEAYGRSPEHRPLLLQLILNEHMLKDDGFRNSVLTWVTGISEVDGVYLVPHITARRKQLSDVDVLLALLEFIRTIRCNDMSIVIGYTNTESIPLLVADPSAITMGSYENMRMFKLEAFLEEETGQTRGPNARIYVPRLLQWVDANYIGAITRQVVEGDSYFDTSKYKVTMFQPTYNWHFQKPEPYKHYFVLFSEQARTLAALEGKDRFEAVVESCRSAIAEFEALKRKGIVLDPESESYHLYPWLTALNEFGKKQGLMP